MGKTRDLLKKIRDIKGTFHAKKGMIKDRNCKDIIEEIKKRWQEYTEKGKESEVSHSCLTLCNPIGLEPTRLFCPWDFPEHWKEQEHWSVLSFSSPRDFPDPGI